MECVEMKYIAMLVVSGFIGQLLSNWTVAIGTAQAAKLVAGM